MPRNEELHQIHVVIGCHIQYITLIWQFYKFVYELRIIYFTVFASYLW